MDRLVAIESRRCAVRNGAAVACLWLALASLGVVPVAEAGVSSSVEPYVVDSFVHDNFGDESKLVFHERVAVPGADWIRLRFEAWNLGPNSFIHIFVTADPSVDQVLDARSLPQWSGWSAYFGEDEVSIELWAGPRDTGVFFRVDQVVVGKPTEADDVGIDDLCGSDNRVPSDDLAVGRVAIPSPGPGTNHIAYCTAFLIGNGALLSAGHCVEVMAAGQVVEFNVHESSANGVPAPADPDDQYPIDIAARNWLNVQGHPIYGDDWGIFRVFPNSDTHLLPHQVQAAFVRLTREAPANGSTVRITGFGSSTDGPRSFTQQTATGPLLAEVHNVDLSYFEYLVDTAGSSSGSPIYRTTAVGEFSIGIHTDAGCSIPEYGNVNRGTSFEANVLENAINEFPGTDIVHVDYLSAAPQANGSLLAPYSGVAMASLFAADGGTISIAAGSYAGDLTLDRHVTLIAPVGPAILGGTITATEGPDHDGAPLAADSADPP